jgi:hypothetical protein
MSLLDIKGQRTLRRILLAAFVIGLVHIALFLLLHPGLWNGKTFLGWDAVEQQWPDIVAVKHAISAGELPLWSPYEKAGYPQILDPEVSPLYPIHWLLYLLMSLFGEGYWVVLIKALIHYGIGAVGMQLFLARYGVGTAGRWVGSTAYILNSRVAKAKDQASLGVAAWFPYMMIATEEVIKKPSWRSGLMLGTVTAVNLHAGYPPNTVRNVMAMLPYALILLIWRMREVKRPAFELRKIAASGGLAVLTAVLLGLPLIFSLQGFAEATRAEMPLREVLDSPTRPADLAQLFSPAASHHLHIHIYAGLAVTIAALYAVLNASGRIRWLWTALAAVFLMMACGAHMFLLPALVALAKPVFGSWRGPQLYVFQSIFFISALAGLGITALLRPTRKAWVKAHWLGFGALAFAALVYVAMNAKPKIPPARIDAAMISVGVALVLALCLYWIHRHKDSARKRRALWVLYPLLVLDMSLLIRPIYEIKRPVPPVQRDVELRELAGVGRDVRLADFRYFHYRVGLRRDVREIFGRMTALVTKRFADYQRAARRDVRLLAAANVAYVAGGNWRHFQRQKPGPFKRIGKVIKLERHAPFAYWTDQVSVVKDAPQALAWMRKTPPGQQAVVESADLDRYWSLATAAGSPGSSDSALIQSWRKGSATSGAKKGQPSSRVITSPAATSRAVSATLLHFGRNSLRLKVNAPATGVLVVSEAFAPHWQATLDGKPVPILRTNYLFRGILVTAGEHRIEMVYRPRGLLAACLIYAVTVAVLLLISGWLFVCYVRRRRRETQA